MSAHGFWKHVHTTIFDFRIMGAPTYRWAPPHKSLFQNDMGKKEKYLGTCLKCRCHFPPLRFSIYGMVVREVATVTKFLTFLLRQNWHIDHPHLCGYMCAHLPIVLVQLPGLLLHGAWENQNRVCYPTWGSDSGLVLYGTVDQ